MKRIDSSGVSPLLGMILGLAIIVGAIGIVQQVFVPAWLKEDEGDHYFKMKSEFEKIDEKLKEAVNYGTSSLNLDLEMRYPDYPFLITPNTVTSSLYVKKIGKIDSQLFNRRVNVTAIILDPKYYYTDVPEEMMILGEYFINENPIKTSQIFDGNRLVLVIYDGDEKSYSGNVKLVFSGSGSFNGNGAPTWFNLSVGENYTWYVKYLDELFRDYGITPNVDPNYRWINFTMNESNRIVIYYAVTIPGNTSDIINPAGAISGFRISNESDMTDLVENNTVEIDLTSLTQGHHKGDSLPSFYILGNMTPNTKVGVNINYTLLDKHNRAKGTTSQSFYWYSDANGHFQLPITPPSGHEGNIRKVRAEITFTFGDGETRQYIVDFILRTTGDEDEDNGDDD